MLYYLPFAELEGFYGSMGFAAVKDMAQVPEAVLKNMSGVTVITTNRFCF